MTAQLTRAAHSAVFALVAAVLTASCGGGGETKPADQPPQITTTPVTAATAGAAYSYQLKATDADGDTLTYSLAQSPSGMTIDAGTGLIAWTPSASQAGTQPVTARVADPAGLAVTQDFSIAVVVANAAPRITSTPPTTAVAGTAYSYAASATDSNGDALSYSLTQSPSGMTIVAGSGLLTWTPTAAQIGSQGVTVRVADPGGLAATQTFSISVVAANAAPQITTTPPTSAQAAVAYSYQVNATDPNGDTLAYSLTRAPSGMTINASGGLIAWTPTAAQTGSQVVTVRVADPGGLAAVQTFSISVAAANVAPQITTTPGTTAQVGAAYSYAVGASDANGDTLAFSLTQAPSGMTIVAGTGAIAWTPAASQTGAQAVSVRVADPGGLVATQAFTIAVAAANASPQITTTAVTTAQAGVAYSYAVGATDPNGDKLTFSLTQSPSGMSINATSGLVAWTPTSAQTGAQGVTVRVADPGGLAATQTYSIAVAAANVAPQINSTAVTTAEVGTAYSYAVSATDANGDTLSFSLSQKPTGMTISSSGLIAWTPTSAQTGAQAVTVRVTDPAGLAATQAFTISVSTAASANPMTMSCADGSAYQCSGTTVYRTDNGIALSRSGVQAYGRSTSDLIVPNAVPTTAFGFALTSGGMAEIRVRKDSNAVPTGAAVLLSNLGLMWNGINDRPQIIETFNPTAGRVLLDGTGALSFVTPVPPSSDLTYYDFATLGSAGTKANYANNRYFPRTDPPRCVAGDLCVTLETSGPQISSGDWRSNGSDADLLSATRYHEDGDVHAGNGLPDASGNATMLPGATGFGVPMPGSKGYRTLSHWSYRYANLAAWVTEDTVNLCEWAVCKDDIKEHSKNRRGVVAFGDTPDPTTVPTSGTATYVGVVYGNYSPTGTADAVRFQGTVTVTVDFASRNVSVSIQNTTRSEDGASVPVALTAAVALRTGNDANYLTGLAANASLSGGLSGRLFGPIATGGSGSGPAEIGGAFSLSNSGTGATVVGGFIARKQ